MNLRPRASPVASPRTHGGARDLRAYATRWHALVPYGVLGCMLAAFAGPAHAADGDLPRTPMIHLGEQCLTVIDRSKDPVVHLDYTIPVTDVCLTNDEPSNSRTHQLIAFCRGTPPGPALPPWLTRAEAELLSDPAKPVPAKAVLDEHPDFAGCWHPVLAASERREITCAAARPGIDWDTTGLPAGVYLVRGYTFQPPDSTWSARHGLFKVVDDADPSASAPAVSIANRDTYLWLQQAVRLRLCVDAMPGATVELAFAERAETPTWQTIVSDLPVATGTVDYEFTPPETFSKTTLVIRATITDPLSRQTTAYMQGEIVVQAIPAPGEPPPPAEAVDPEILFDFCRDHPDADLRPECPQADPTTTETDTDDSSDPNEPGDGCRCNVLPGETRAPHWLALLVVFGLTRRRTST